MLFHTKKSKIVKDEKMLQSLVSKQDLALWVFQTKRLPSCSSPLSTLLTEECIPPESCFFIHCLGAFSVDTSGDGQMLQAGHVRLELYRTNAVALGHMLEPLRGSEIQTILEPIFNLAF